MIDPSDTRIDVRNSGARNENLRNWTLVLGQTMAVTLGDIELNANQTRTLHLAAGTTTDSDVYLGLGSGLTAATFGPGERIVLVSPRDGIASIYRPS